MSKTARAYPEGRTIPFEEIATGTAVPWFLTETSLNKALYGSFDFHGLLSTRKRFLDRISKVFCRVSVGVTTLHGRFINRITVMQLFPKRVHNELLCFRGTIAHYSYT